MSFAVKEESLHAAIEATYNTSVAITATDAIEVEELSWTPDESARIIERMIVNNSLAPLPHQYGGSLVGFQFSAELKGSGVLGTAPRVGRLLRACAMSETIVAGTSVTYQPESSLSDHDSLTIQYQEGPNRRLASGVRGNVSVGIDTGGRIMASFTMIGHIASDTQSAGVAQTFETTLPPIFRGANFRVAGVATPIGKLAFDLSNTMGIAPNPNTADGFGQIRVTSRKVTGSFDPEAKAINTQDFIGSYRGATEFTLATGTIGSVAGNRVAISFPRCQYTKPGPGERESMRIYEMSYSAFPTANGDDDVAIQFK